MPANTKPVFPLTVKSPVAKLENADGTTSKALVTAGTNGSRINSVIATSDDTAAIDVILYHNDGTNDYPIARVTVPAGSGTDGTNPPISLLEQANVPSLRSDLSWLLQNGHVLKVGAQSAVTAAKVISIVAQVGDY